MNTRQISVIMATAAMIGLVLIHGIARAGNTDARIKGAAEFLVERAQDNYFYVFEKRMDANPAFACYFPNTHAFAKSGDLALLLKARTLWDENLRKDLRALAAQAVAEKALTLADILNASAVDIVRDLEVNIGGQWYSRNYLPLNPPDDVKAASDAMDQAFNEAQERLIALSANFGHGKGECLPPGKDVNLTEVRNGLIAATAGYTAWGNSLLDGAWKLRVKGDNGSEGGILAKLLGNDGANQLDEFSSLVTTLDGLINSLKGWDPNAEGSDTVSMVLKAKALIEAQIREGFNPLGLDVEGRDFRRFTRYAVFVAQVTDASTPDEVKTALDEVTLPAVSFGEKRRPQETRLMIQSYLGATGGLEGKAGGGRISFAGITAPVGVELSRGLAGDRSLGVLLAPLDLGVPVNLKFKKRDEKVTFQDIFAPGIYLTYGWTGLPVSWMMGYAHGPSLRGDHRVANRAMISISFDMPLFGLN